MTAPTERQFQTAVLELAKLRGWMWFHDYDSRRNKPGFPDLVLLHPRTGQLVFAELKTASGKVSAKQQEWIDALYRGGHVVAVWRPAHLHNGQIARALTPSEIGVSA